MKIKRGKRVFNLHVSTFNFQQMRLPYNKNNPAGRMQNRLSIKQHRTLYAGGTTSCAHTSPGAIYVIRTEKRGDLANSTAQLLAILLSEAQATRLLQRCKRLVSRVWSSAFLWNQTTRTRTLPRRTTGFETGRQMDGKTKIAPLPVDHCSTMHTGSNYS